MKTLKPMNIGKSTRQARAREVLLGLVELYIRTGVPIGSNTLRDIGFQHLSSATLRNYFVDLEEEGFLSQQHASGGRIPTAAAYRYYAGHYRDASDIEARDREILAPIGKMVGREITQILEKSAHLLGQATQCAVLLSAPRFDHDFIVSLKLVGLDAERCLCILISDFGVIKTEVLRTEKPLSSHSLKRVEGYFHWRLTGHDKPQITPEEEVLAQQFYNEMMVRYVVGYSNFSDEEIYRTGLARLLGHPDFSDVKELANSLSLFENPHGMRLLLRECTAAQTLKFWVGNDLAPFSTLHPSCSVIATPYHIAHKVVGAIGILGPERIPYKHLFGILRHCADHISEVLTKSVYKFEIRYRQPQREVFELDKSERILLEDKRQDTEVLP